MRIVAGFLGIALALSACGDGNSNPMTATQPVLAFTFTPSPAPTAGINVGCAGVLLPLKTWYYSLSVRNLSNTPFLVSAVSYTLSLTGSPSPPAVTNVDLAAVSAAFGTLTIPAGASIQGALCTILSGASGTVSYTFSAADGRGPFTSAALSLLP